MVRQSSTREGWLKKAPKLDSRVLRNKVWRITILITTAKRKSARVYITACEILLKYKDIKLKLLTGFLERADSKATYSRSTNRRHTEKVFFLFFFLSLRSTCVTTTASMGNLLFLLGDVMVQHIHLTSHHTSLCTQSLVYRHVI